MLDRLIDNRGLDSFDYRFLALVLAILGIGVLSIHSVTHSQQTGLAP
jgi:rod shape determining protein RodA